MVEPMAKPRQGNDDRRGSMAGGSRPGQETLSLENPSVFLDAFCAGETAPGKEKGVLRRAFGLTVKASLVGAILVLGVTLTGNRIADAPEHRLDKLLEAGAYRECLSLGNRLLRERPGDERIAEILKEALVKAVLEGGWADRLVEGDFDAAREVMDGVAMGERESIREQMAALRWITDLEAHFRGKSPERPVSIFRDEIPIRSLLLRWDSDRPAIRDVLNRLSDTEGSGVDRHRIYQRLGRLQEWELVHLANIRELTAAIRRGLDRGDLEPLFPAIETFRKRNPAIGGTDALLQDLSTYLSVVKAVQEDRQRDLPPLLAAFRLEEGPFSRRVEPLRAALAPHPASKPDAPSRFDTGREAARMSEAARQPPSKRAVQQNTPSVTLFGTSVVPSPHPEEPDRIARLEEPVP